MIPTDALNEEDPRSPTAATAGTPVEIEILLSGVTFGPYTAAKVRERLAENLLSLQDSARVVDSVEWRPLQDVLEAIPPEPEPEPEAARPMDEEQTVTQPENWEELPAESANPTEVTPLREPDPAMTSAHAVPPPAIIAPPERSTMVLPPQGPSMSQSRALEGNFRPRSHVGTGPLPAPPRQTSALVRPGARTGSGQLIRPNSGRPQTKTLGGIRSQILARTASQLPTISRPGTASSAGLSMTAPLSLKSLRSSGAVTAGKGSESAGLLGASKPVPDASPSGFAPLAPPLDSQKTARAGVQNPRPPANTFYRPPLTPIRAEPPPPVARSFPAKPAAFEPPISTTPEPSELEAPANLHATPAAIQPADPVGPASPKLNVPAFAAPLPPPGAPILKPAVAGNPPFRLPGRFPTSRPKLDEDEAPSEPAPSPPSPATPEESSTPMAELPPVSAAALSGVSEAATEEPAASENPATTTTGTDLTSPPEGEAEDVPPAGAFPLATKLASGSLPLPPAKPAEKRPAPSIDSILTVRLPARRTQVIKTLPGAPVVKGPELKPYEAPAPSPPTPSPTPGADPRFAVTVPIPRPVASAESREREAPAPVDLSLAAQPARPIPKAVNPVRRGMAKESALAATKLLNPSEKKASALGVPSEKFDSPVVSMPPPANVDFSPPRELAPDPVKENPLPSSATPLVETRRAALKQSRQRRRRQGIAIAVTGVIFFLIICAGIYHFTASNRDIDKPLPASQPAATTPAKTTSDATPNPASTSAATTPDATALAPPAGTPAPASTAAPAPPTTTVAPPPPAAGSTPNNAAPTTDPAPPPAPAVDPKVQAHVTQGQADQAKGDLDGALSEFTQAILLDPKYVQGYSYRAAVNQAKGDLAAAISDVNQLLTLDPSNANGFCQRGFLKQANKDSDGAFADYGRAIELDPKSYVALYNRGMIEEQKGQPDPAILDYNHALELNPRLAGAFYNRGNAKMDKSDFDGAIADYTNALFLNPKIALASCNRGLAEQDMGNFDAALADYNKAISVNPNIAVAYYNRGLIEEQQDHLDSCVDDSTKALELSPDDAQAYYNRGVALQAKGNLDAAANDLRKFFELAPKNAYADYARLYLWVITNLQNRKTEADQELAAGLDSSWNAEPAQLPSKIAAFLLGRVPETDLLVLAASTDPKKDQSQHCEVWYFDGIKKMLTGNKGGAIDCFHRCLGTNEKNFCEYILAEAQLHVLSPS